MTAAAMHGIIRGRVNLHLGHTALAQRTPSPWAGCPETDVGQVRPVRASCKEMLDGRCADEHPGAAGRKVVPGLVDGSR